MVREGFFEQPLEQSKVKSQIVAKYFDAWAKIVSGAVSQIRYIDLFAGQGYYDDGTESTPLLIIRKAIEDDKINQKVTIEFNDKNSQFIEGLKHTVDNLDGVKNLGHPPIFTTASITHEIVKRYEGENNYPRLFFLDPWGYKGLSLDLIKVAIRGWASECILFFNYKRINMDLQKSAVDKNINDLLGLERANSLRCDTDGLSPYKREEIIIDRLCEAIKQMGAKYVLPFCFRDRKQNRTSHYLIHACKHPRGYGLMKEIMDEYSSKDIDGVPTFTFDPKKQLNLNFNCPLSELADQLTENFKGKTLKVRSIYDEHQFNTRFTVRNYKDALIKLEQGGKIQVDRPSETRQIRKGKITLGDERMVTFI